MDADNQLVTPPALPPHIRTVDANRGVEWIAVGFRMFMKSPGTWLLVALALLVGFGIVNAILPSLLAAPLSYMVGVVALGVLMRSCQMFEQGGDFVAHMQTTASAQPLWILGLIAAGLNFAVMLLVGMLGLSSFAVVATNPAAILHVLGLSFLVLFGVSILLSMALWLAPALLVFKGVAPIDAIKLSFEAALKNIAPFIVYSLLAFVLSMLAVFTLGLGFLVLAPVFIYGCYQAYKDIFDTESA